MKIRVERDVLADAVAWAARTLPSRPSLPVLAGLVITADADTVTLSSFDYEVSGRVEIEADVAETGTSLVSGRLLADIARSLPAAPVTIESEGTRLAIACGRSSFTLPTLPVEDYPQLPVMPTTSGAVSGSLFAAAVGQVAVAAGRDDTLPTLTGIRMEFEGASITLAATDRYRLAVREFAWSPESSSMSAHALVPARTLADTAKSLADVDEVIIALAAGGSGEGLVGFEGHGRRTTTRLLDGEFPKYRSLLPTESSAVATVETSSLADAVKRVALVAERNTPVRLLFEGSELTLRAGAGDDAQAVEVIEVALEGDPIDIAFNPAYLLDGLSATGAEEVRFSFTQPTRPAVITAATQADAGTDYRYLLMPVRLTG
ncbi:MAG: DNA polymerase III subunit beta [Actinomycetales bacterium]|nr:DNA polymerase III subunit beta [Actinomycetales bacterium]